MNDSIRLPLPRFRILASTAERPAEPSLAFLYDNFGAVLVKTSTMQSCLASAEVVVAQHNSSQ